MAELAPGDATVATAQKGLQELVISTDVASEDEAWIAMEVATVKQELEREHGGDSKEHLAHAARARAFLVEAEEEARQKHAKRRAEPPPGPPLKLSDLQALFRRDIGYLYRSKMASSVHDEFDKLCLLPEDCRDERADALLGEPQLAELRKRRVVVIDWAMKPKDVLAVRAAADALDNAGALKPIPTFSGYQARNDRATWITGEGDHPLAKATRLLQGCAAKVQADGDFEPLIVPPKVMLALYPGKGARYTKHKDSLDDDPRRVTIILYLQTLAWNSDRDGGELSVQSPVENNPQRIEPKGGRLVIFDSRTVEHEVLPSRGMRMALTLWLRKAGVATVVAGAAGEKVENTPAGDGAAA